MGTISDNVLVDNGTGTDYTVASDDDGTAQHQYAKVEFGGDGTFTKVTSTVGLPVNPVQETASVGVGAIADAEAASGNGSVISLLKRVRTLLNGGLPAALSSNSALKVEQVVAGPTQPISGTVTATLAATVVEDAASAGGESSVLIAGVRNDAATSRTSTDGDFGNLALDSVGRVGIADLGGSISVDDNSGSITVDGTVAATQSGTWTVQPGNTANTTAWKVDGSAVTQPVSGTVAVTNSDVTASAASLSVVDDWDESDRAKVNPIAGQAGVAAGSGTVSALTQRVVLATDVALPAGTAAIGKLAANSGVDIGDVDVTSVSGNVTVIQGTATNLKVDASGVAVPITDNSGSITVDGTIAATQSGTWTVQPGNTANTTAWKVDGSAVTQPVSGTVTATPTGTYTTKETRAATSALTTVADNASSTSILASNANRLKAVITNDSSARLYLRFEAAAASTSNYMVSLAQNETWEELTWTGEIRGIWATDPNDGAARVVEFTA